MGEFWARFREWSAFGAPVELEIESGAAVTQFYVPYLSGLQLYRRSPGGGGEAASDGVRAEEGPPAGVGWLGGGTAGGGGGQGVPDPPNLGPDMSIPGRECLCVEYLESTSPAGRAPLSDKIAELAGGELPELLRLHSAELHPSSWLAIAWYPLYCIPGGRPTKDLSACFLTFHSFSGSLPECSPLPVPSREELARAAEQALPGGNGLALYPFAYAAYKVSGGVWTDGAVGERHLALMSDTAAWWLGRHGTTMPDLEFFRQKGLLVSQGGGNSDSRRGSRKNG